MPTTEMRNAPKRQKQRSSVLLPFRGAFLLPPTDALAGATIPNTLPLRAAMASIMQRAALTIAVRRVDDCSALRWRLQRTALAIAARCVDGCGRVRWKKQHSAPYTEAGRSLWKQTGRRGIYSFPPGKAGEGDFSSSVFRQPEQGLCRRHVGVVKHGCHLAPGTHDIDAGDNGRGKQVIDASVLLGRTRECEPVVPPI